MAFGARVKAARLSRKLTQQQLADAVGCKQGNINAIESRDAKTSKYTEAIASALRISIAWLMTGQGDSGLDGVINTTNDNENYVLDSTLEVVGSFETWDNNTPLGADEVALPFYKEVEVSAGCGRNNISNQAKHKVRFSKSTLQSAGVQVKDAIIMRLTGDSMERLITDGSMIGVDTSKASDPIKDNKIYALEVSGMLRCKYLQRLAGDRIKVYSENKLYEDEIYDMEKFASLYRIVGGVFWWSTLERW